MRLRLVPCGVAVLAVLAAVNVYLKPTSAQFAAAQARLHGDEVQIATLASRARIVPRIVAERHAIAARLRGLHALDPSMTEAHILTDLTVLAQRSGVTLAAYTGKGPAAALAPAGTPTAMPAAGAQAGAAAIETAVPGVRLPRSIVVSGRLAGILRFVDGLGVLPELVRVGGLSLAQTEQLRATIDVDVLVFDQASLRGALRE
jgi:hypothetical protein